MNDFHIRSALRRKLHDRFSSDPTTLIIDELGLNNGKARADIVVINSLLHGYELKSDLDSLDRLPYQVRNYNAVFDRVTLVVGYAHAYNGVKIIPRWWGLTLAKMGIDGSVYLTVARLPRSNPKPDALALARLLWRDEALALLEQSGNALGVRSKSKEAIYMRIVESVNFNMLRDWVCQQLRLRANWKAGAIQRQYDG